MKLTIYTPIDSNYANLDVIYDSLVNQTNRDFVWFIIDYNTIETANTYVPRFQSEQKIQVKYLHKPSKGRYLATRFAFENIQTEYVLGLDGGYTIVNDCVEVMLTHWDEIEIANLPIAEIRGLAEDASGKLIGISHYRYEAEFVDSNWHEMVLKNGNYFEMLACWNRLKFLESVNFDRYALFADKIDELSTTLFWSSLGRNFKTRYLNKSLKVKIVADSSKKPVVNQYNSFVSNYYFIAENLDWYFYSPKYYSSVVYSLIKSASKLKLSLRYLLKLNRSLRYKMLVTTYYLPAMILRKIK